MRKFLQAMAGVCLTVAAAGLTGCSVGSFEDRLLAQRLAPLLNSRSNIFLFSDLPSAAAFDTGPQMLEWRVARMKEWRADAGRSSSPGLTDRPYLGLSSVMNLAAFYTGKMNYGPPLPYEPIARSYFGVSHLFVRCDGLSLADRTPGMTFGSTVTSSGEIRRTYTISLGPTKITGNC
jgi:hypothetical protein